MSHATDKSRFEICRNECGIFCTSEEFKDVPLLHWSTFVTSEWRWFQRIWETHDDHFGSSQDWRSIAGNGLWAGRVEQLQWTASTPFLRIEFARPWFPTEKRKFTEAIPVFFERSCSHTVTDQGNIASQCGGGPKRQLRFLHERQRCFFSVRQDAACSLDKVVTFDDQILFERNYFAAEDSGGIADQIDVILEGQPEVLSDDQSVGEEFF